MYGDEFWVLAIGIDCYPDQITTLMWEQKIMYWMQSYLFICHSHCFVDVFLSFLAFCFGSVIVLPKPGYKYTLFVYMLRDTHGTNTCSWLKCAQRVEFLNKNAQATTYICSIGWKWMWLHVYSARHTRYSHMTEAMSAKENKQREKGHIQA